MSNTAEASQNQGFRVFATDLKTQGEPGAGRVVIFCDPIPKTRGFQPLGEAARILVLSASPPNAHR
jgi:hypothetical protein